LAGSKAHRWVGQMEEISDILEKTRHRGTCTRRSPGYDYLAAAHAEAQPGRDNAIRTLDRILGAPEV